jgi:hypothetical protein
MLLLVSVRSVQEVEAALGGGADIIDAKEPSAGALGAVALPVFHEIRAAVGDRVPVSAALGDILDAGEALARSRTYATTGASFVKIGFAGTSDPSCVRDVLAAAARGAHDVPRSSIVSTCAVIAVAYADAGSVDAIEPRALLDCADRSGARGVLLDTASKTGGSLRDLVTPAWLRAWVADAHAAGLQAAVAGRLCEDDVMFVRDVGADIIGVRGAACEGGRLGVVSTDSVRRLRNRIDHAEFERVEGCTRALSGAS